MSNARKGPSGADIKVATVEVSGAIITLTPPRIQTIDVLRLDVVAPGTHQIHGLTPGKPGQRIRILAAPDTGAGDFTLVNQSGSAVAGTAWFFTGTRQALIPPSNFDAIYDVPTGMWWLTSIAED